MYCTRTTQSFDRIVEHSLPAMPDAPAKAHKENSPFSLLPPQLKFETCLSVIPEREMSVISVLGRKENAAAGII